MIKQKERAEKRLLSVEVFMGVTASVVLFALVFLAAFGQMSNGIRILLISLGFILFLAICLYALRIEQVAGYYECKHCNHRYVPTYKAVKAAPHVGRTRYMRCPKCNKKSWQKKVVSKE